MHINPYGILIYSPIVEKPLVVRVVLDKIVVLGRRVTEVAGGAVVVAVAIRIRTTPDNAHLRHPFT